MSVQAAVQGLFCGQKLNVISVLKNSHKTNVKYLILLYLFPGISCCVPFWLITGKEHKKIMPITSWLLSEKFLWSWKRKIAPKPNSTVGRVHWLYQPTERGREVEWEEAERKGEGLLKMEKASWTLEKPDPRSVCRGWEERITVQTGFCTGSSPPRYLACLNVEMKHFSLE